MIRSSIKRYAQPYCAYFGIGIGVLAAWSLVKLCLVVFLYHYTPSASWVILPLAYLLPKACVSIGAGYWYLFGAKTSS